MALAIDEVRRDSRAADREDLERGDLFRAMVLTPAWKEYVKLLEAKLQAYSDQLLAPAGSIDGMVGSEWIKGAMSGLIIARGIASATIDTADSIRRARLGAQAGDDDVDVE